MGATPLENELLQYWAKLTLVQQESIISVIKSMVQPDPEINIELYNREVDESVARVEGGKFYTQEEVEKMSTDW